MNIVIERIEASSCTKNDQDPMVGKLLEKGFNLEDIETAMNLVSIMTSRVDPIMKVSERECSSIGKPVSIRHLHAYESVRLSTEAQQMLLKLVEEEIISSLHFERVLEYIWKNDLRSVGISRMELILLMSKPDNGIDTLPDKMIPQSMELH